ncbi:MAG TPA: alpha/beta hydrolase [Gaiellaceae bacterium]|nr:alpha/beta hydrolase [Gaiellaceae bacterium]
MSFFDGFELDRIEVGDVTLRVRHGGSGSPVVLLHGHPRTHATWHRVAALLAPQHTVVCPDLRGYGESTTTGDQSKRAMANDVGRLMQQLGHERYAVLGHDRGAYVAFRLALDHAAAVERLAIVEAMPLVERLERTDWRFAASWWHWWFFAQREKPAESFINADPDAWYAAKPDLMGDEAYADLRRALRNPDVVHAMVEDYRAGPRADREHDEADRAAGRKISCPLLIVSLLQDDPELDHGASLEEIWRPWADDVRTDAIDCGHHVAEEAPDELARVLLAFL